ncbi:hypothetical protein Ahy_A06g026377 isoform A [Arachis hypogaea]|uniref:Uncharacterized protein n=1 Tax=Arachis hypogaea TaxID=3818 RepID=A0A445CKD0_ARAHY|nr:hypothetical protein Ahy_A06g026377 isoform A [Arachis hypogaea]
MVVITSKALADNCFRRWSLVPEIGAISSGGRDFDESLIDKLARFSMVLSSIFEDGKIGISPHLRSLLVYIRKCLPILVQLHKLGWCWHLHPTSDSRFLLDQQALSWLSFYPFNRSHAVVVAVTVNISSYCYWFHCEVLSRRVCHPYYIAPVV